ncbi:Transposase DDE domain protein [Lignipirellula cremea]|uniref:Transposase DDE domain protein n=2 Tax=Lignipirellula cremea TaxID=2528010 RepID=A0A518E1Z0_9BACT|nr:Transposase DDE domain protein [Lignipirellula cremea]QDU95696.1 Transposase DDE domain protein [Lignipirellula cremea]QDU98105.1 Transposase DDE domain protein [Lignipirellula cremea]QDU98323.1 Transposase DDE domain protein [Lignipirellula cremea]
MAFQHLQLAIMMTEIQFDNVDSILTSFGELTDPRSHINRLHLFGDLLVISIMAVIAGADGPQAIGIWAKHHQTWLKKHLVLPHGVPSHDTFGRLLGLLKPAAFQKCFEAWIRSIAPLDKETDLNQIAIDGKVLKRSHDRKRKLGPLWLVSAWSVDRSLSLGQLATDEKSNEITAIPELLENIEVQGAVVTIDAAGCQREIARKIIDGHGDYLLALKGNQGKLYEAVTDYILLHMENDFADIPARRFTETLHGHGRVDEITYYQMPVPKDLVNREKWPGLKTIGVAIRQSESGSKTSSDARFYIGSIALGVKKFARYVRGHWAIENTLHWCLDVTFREDENRVRERTTADNLAWLKRFALSMLKQQDDKYSIAMRRRVAGWDLDYLAKILGIPVL